MHYLPDCLAFGCLFLDGLFVGYFFKFDNVYDTLWIRSHWYPAVGIGVSLLLAALWSYKKHVQRQYRFHHFYVIFYGLICFLISDCFLFNENFEIIFYFGFAAHASLFLSSYSYISLRSNSEGSRPARLALANCTGFAGLASGFAIFNPFKASECAWIQLGLTLCLIAATVINEILQHRDVHNYKTSNDVVFNLMNEEKLIFLPPKSVYALFKGRPDFYITRNRQWLVLALIPLLALERLLLYSKAFMQLAWTSALAYTGTQHRCGPFVLHALGGALGSALMARYKPQLVYVMFGLIKITATAAVLGVYTEFLPENCFVFLCFYYTALGVHSSIALQAVLECSPFLWTELIFAGLIYALELLVMELLQLPHDPDELWSLLLGTGVGSIILTIVCFAIVHLYLPKSAGLLDIRNHLLGIRRHRSAVPQSKIWNSNYFLHHDLESTDVTYITLPGHRVFQQYPRQGGGSEKKTRF